MSAEKRGKRALWARLVLGALAVVALAGCVERKMMILSEPPAAKVYVDGDYVGETPLSVPFVHYGTREIQVAKDGYQSQRRQEDLRAPAYEIMPIDFFSEVLYPGRLVDHHLVTFKLEKTQLDVESLIERAQYFKALSHALEPEPTKEPSPPQQ